MIVLRVYEEADAINNSDDNLNFDSFVPVQDATDDRVERYNYSQSPEAFMADTNARKTLVTLLIDCR